MLVSGPAGDVPHPHCFAGEGGDDILGRGGKWHREWVRQLKGGAARVPGTSAGRFGDLEGLVTFEFGEYDCDGGGCFD